MSNRIMIKRLAALAVLSDDPTVGQGFNGTVVLLAVGLCGVVPCVTVLRAVCCGCDRWGQPISNTNVGASLVVVLCF